MWVGKMATLRLTDGRRAILHNETRPEDGAVYLFGMSDQQNLRTYRVRHTAEEFRLVPEEEPATVVPGMMLLFRVIGADD